MSEATANTVSVEHVVNLQPQIVIPPAPPLPANPRGTATEGSVPTEPLLQQTTEANGEPKTSLSLQDMNDCMDGIVYNDNMEILPINLESMGII